MNSSNPSNESIGGLRAKRNEQNPLLNDKGLSEEMKSHTNGSEKKKSVTIGRNDLIFGIKPSEDNKLSSSAFMPSQKMPEHMSVRERNQKKRSRPIMDYIVISSNSAIYKAFKGFIVLLCIVSSFVYAFYAAFRLDVDQHPDFVVDETLNLQVMDNIQYVFEFLFLVDMITKFILDYTDEINNTQIRDLSTISLRYLKSQFIWDLLPLIPFNWVLHFQYSRLFYLVKVIRLIETFALLTDNKGFMNIIKKFFESRLKKVCEDPKLAENIDLDQNKIMMVIMIGYAFKTFKLVIVIFQVSYFIGIFFYIYCSIVKDAANGEADTVFFIDEYLINKNSYERAIAITYYAFTSLSTVGFGDMYPVNNYERAVVAMILLFGVAIFSLVMGNFIEILDTFNKVNADFDDGDTLAMFLGNLEHFNQGRKIDQKLKEQIEDFMDYRWSNHKNNAMTSSEDTAMLDQLPVEIQRRIYSDFLFKNFLKSFKKYFSLRNMHSPHRYSFYTWQNFEFQNFMIAILQRLEPIRYGAKQIIFNELDDVNEVVFIETGLYDIGYEVNKQMVLKMRQINKTVIGAFEVSFDKRVLFIYRTFQECKGYIIRKQLWRELESEHPDLYQSVKWNSMFHYIHKIRRPLLQFKQEDIEFYDKRADYQQVLVLRNYNENEIKDLVDGEVAKGVHNHSQESLCMREIEKTVNKYERYLGKIMVNFDKANTVQEYAQNANDELMDENQKLRKLAAEKGIDVDKIIKEAENLDEEFLLPKLRD